MISASSRQLQQFVQLKDYNLSLWLHQINLFKIFRCISIYCFGCKFSDFLQISDNIINYYLRKYRRLTSPLCGTRISPRCRASSPRGRVMLKARRVIKHCILANRVLCLLLNDCCHFSSLMPLHRNRCISPSQSPVIQKKPKICC